MKSCDSPNILIFLVSMSRRIYNPRIKT